jgi:HK97 family phage major capsid protein
MPTPEEITAAAQAAETLRAANQGLTTQVLQLRAIAEAHGKGQQASEILAAKPLENARAEIMALLATTPVSVPRSLEDMGASDAERKNFSYARLLSASVSLQEGKRDANCLELEVSSAIAKTMPGTYKQRGGVFVPFQINARAAMDTQTPTAGKELVYTQPAELIEILRSKLIAAKMGARFLTGLQGPMGFSKQTGQAIAHWITENSGADAAESEPVTGILTLSPKTLIGGAQFSRQLLETGTWSVEQMIRADLAYSHAAAFDLAAFHGTGVGQPTGIYNLAGVNAVAMGGVSPTYQELLTMITDIAGANGLLDSMGWVTNPIVAGNLMGKLEFAVNGAKTIWTGNVEEGVMAGYKAAASNLVRKDLGVGTNEHGMAIGSWSQVIIGCFGGGFEIITDPFKYKLQGLIDVATFEMGDVLVRHPESFTKATGLIPS